MIMLDRAGASNSGGYANKQAQNDEPTINIEEQAPAEETIRVEDIPF
jgi:hypothetical protein